MFRSKDKATVDQNRIIQLIKSGDKRGLEYLYQQYGGALHGVILRLVKQETYAEELVQDVFVKIWQNIDQYDPSKGRLYTWMHRIARNKALDKLRSKDVKIARSNREILQEWEPINAKAQISLKTDHLALEQLFKSLNTKQKMVMELVYFQGYTQSEVSKECGIPLGTVKTLIRNALKKIKGLLSAYPAEELQLI